MFGKAVFEKAVFGKKAVFSNSKWYYYFFFFLQLAKQALHNMEPTTHFVTVEQMRREGLLFAKYRKKQIRKAKPSVRVKWFKRAFGITHLTAAHVYRDLQTTDLEDAKIKGGPKQLENFLMALFFLKKYPYNGDMEREFGYTEETCSNKVW